MERRSLVFPRCLPGIIGRLLGARASVPIRYDGGGALDLAGIRHTLAFGNSQSGRFLAWSSA
jgi:hypothetical protein